MLKDSEISAGEILGLLYRFDHVLGLKLKDVRPAAEYRATPEEKAMLEERLMAKKEKNWARADEIRDYFQGKGLILKDTPQGTVILPSGV